MRVQASARRDEVAGERDGRVLVRIAAPPVDGKANAALCRFVARAVGVPRPAVEVVRGHGARGKTLRIDGAEPAAVRAALGLPGSAGG